MIVLSYHIYIILRIESRENYVLSNLQCYDEDGSHRANIPLYYSRATIAKSIWL